jgi:DNA polymerase (family 10)
VPTVDEASFYRTLGLAEIPPELREGFGEVQAAATGTLPVLIERRDLQGFLHCHTGYSDGSTTVEELAVACREAGYSYVGITDHSQSAAYAGGLSPDDLLRQADEIDQVNHKIKGIRVLKGIEADILASGALDYEPATLDRLDFVIGSIHSRFSMGEKEMTVRVLAAMDNPSLTILGHPTGRLLLSRDPYPLALDQILDKAADVGVSIEINADPHRLDLDWRRVREARDKGVTVSIGADAHNLAGLKNVDFGIGMARKGWLTRDQVLNARPAEEFLTFAASRRGKQ